MERRSMAGQIHLSGRKPSTGQTYLSSPIKKRVSASFFIDYIQDLQEFLGEADMVTRAGSRDGDVVDKKIDEPKMCPRAVMAQLMNKGQVFEKNNEDLDLDGFDSLDDLEIEKTDINKKKTINNEPVITSPKSPTTTGGTSKRDQMKKKKKNKCSCIF